MSNLLTMRRILPLAALLCCLSLVACGTVTHVSGTVTDTRTWFTYYSCGQSTCTQTHHSFVVNGQEYQDDWDDVRTGDAVSFDYNSVWGVANMHNHTHHTDDFWLWFLLIGGIVLVVGAVVIGTRWYLKHTR